MSCHLMVDKLSNKFYRKESSVYKIYSNSNKTIEIKIYLK